MKKIDTDRFRHTGGNLKLKDHPTRIPDLYENDADAREQLARQVDKISDLQELLYASDSWALLLSFQAMDAAGKDGAIRHVMSGVNPQGCQVFSFKQPSSMELDHDFLWRTTLCLPERGRIGIFNRSYYEEVLVVRVHPEILGGQGLPPRCIDGRDVWQDRYDSIRDFEAHLFRNGTKVVKFFLNVSREEQKERFLQRIEDETKNWKFSLGDVEERAFWNDYMKAYEDCIEATATKDSPWYLVPADDKKNARLIVSRVIAETLEALDLKVPTLDESRRDELRVAREMLAKEN